MNSTEWNEIRKRASEIKDQLVNGFAAFYDDEYVIDLNMEDSGIIHINILPHKEKYVFEKVNTLSPDTPFKMASDILGGFQLVGSRRK